MIMILISTYRDVKKDQNKELIKNMNAYAEKEKIKKKNQKYWDKSRKQEKVEKRRELACTTSKGIKVYKVWYE